FSYAVLLLLGVRTAWAEVSKEPARELLPIPHCCCWDESACCAAADCSACFAKHLSAAEAKCDQPCAIKHWLQTAFRLDIKNTPLSQVLETLRTKTGLNIIVDEAALSEAGISLERPLTLKVDGMSFGYLLSFLLRQAHLAYEIKDNVLLV